MDSFFALSILFLTVAALSFLMRALKQPFIIGYILAGIILGPLLLNTLPDSNFIELASHIGITFLLFIVGLNLNPKLLREIGRVALLTGASQIIVTASIGFVITLLL